MPFHHGYGTTSVAIAAYPTIVSTFFNHFLTWPSREHRSRNDESTSTSATSYDTLPANQLRYEEGLNVIRRFLDFASRHSVEEVQSFTAQPVPVPRWVHRSSVTIPESQVDEAAGLLKKVLASYGPDDTGIDIVGGDKWWQVRGRTLDGEWIEMRKHYQARKEAKKADRQTWRGVLRHPSGRPHVRDGSGAEVKGDRVILYIHGGAFFFSSLDLHRYQIERHARKAGARAFAPNYRLAPQYPFPCGLQDSLAAYLYLLHPPEGHHAPIKPENIILMGDSAGGGMCLSLLVVIRELGLPMPAAASLMSPWVDLTHSMPSIVEWDGGDYIPNIGFHYKPSIVWPPIPGDGITVDIDGKVTHVDDQIQLYCSNKTLTHPLVSPINNGSLGGLCPLFITAGGAELLRDEVIYVAHKAANPTMYPPSPTTFEQYPGEAAKVDKYPPTQTVLQVYEGACHVATTLAWTRTAKFIFRGTADFNIWAFNNAARTPPSRANSAPGPSKLGMSSFNFNRATTEANGSVPEPAKQTSTSSAPARAMGGSKSSRDLRRSAAKNILDSDSEGVVASPTASMPGSANPSELNLAGLSMTQEQSSAEESETTDDERGGSGAETPDGMRTVHVTGTKPAWGTGMLVAERVSLHGRITPMEPASEIPALNPALRPEIGQVRGHGPIKRWLAKRADWDRRYAKELKEYRDIRLKDHKQAVKQGYLTRNLQGEHPPLAALAGLASPELAAKVGKSVDAPTTKSHKGVELWARLAEKRDAEAVQGNLHEVEDREDRKTRRSMSQSRKSGERRRSTSANPRKSVDAGRRSSEKPTRISGDTARGSMEKEPRSPIVADSDNEGRTKRRSRCSDELKRLGSEAHDLMSLGLRRGRSRSGSRKGTGENSPSDA